MKLNFFTNINKMDFLISLYIFCIVAAELMGGKTFPLIHWGALNLNASVGIFLIPLIYTINDVITEVYGKERARSVVRSGLFMVVMVFLASLIFTSLPPSPRFAKMEPAYDAVFLTSIRIALASLTAFALAEFLDVYVFAKLKEKLGRKRLWLRNNVSNFISQLVDTVVFMSLAFYALGLPPSANGKFLISLIIPYWLLKCFMSIIETPFVYMGVKWLKEDNKK